MDHLSVSGRVPNDADLGKFLRTMPKGVSITRDDEGWAITTPFFTQHASTLEEAIYSMMFNMAQVVRDRNDGKLVGLSPKEAAFLYSAEANRDQTDGLPS